MILHLHDVAPQVSTPLPDQPERARFLNLLIRLVAAIYPTFTYGDNPPQWTTEGAPADLLRERVHTRRAELWQELERQAGAPHMLGERFSALDLYVAVMTRWRPGPAWFESVCPALTAVARAGGTQSGRGSRAASQLPSAHRIARLSACRGAASSEPRARRYRCRCRR